jgi:hypothetical protein
VLGYVCDYVRIRKWGCGSGSSLTEYGFDDIHMNHGRFLSEMHKMGWSIYSPKTRNSLSDDEILHMLYNAANEPDVLQEA